MDRKLLTAIRDHVAARPSRFSAAHWGWARNAGDVIRNGEPPRDFRCCIAGHALVMGGIYSERDLVCQSGIVNEDGYLWQRAAEVLRLSTRQANRLFFPSQWDDPFKRQYYLGSRDEESAVCAAYIDHFMDREASRLECEAESAHGLEAALSHV